MMIEVIVVEVIVVEVIAVEVMTNLMKEAKNAKIIAIAVVEIGGARLCVIFACKSLNVVVVVIVVDVAVVVDVADVADVTENKKCGGEANSSCWLECQTNEAKCL